MRYSRQSTGVFLQAQLIHRMRRHVVGHAGHLVQDAGGVVGGEGWGGGQQEQGGEGEDLRVLKNKPEIIGLVAKKAKHAILWTERGAARHAKMLETDQAWDVFEQLEDAYFSGPVRQQRQPVVDGNKRSTKHDRLPLYHFAVDTVIKHKLMFNKVYVLLNLFAGTRSFQEMTKEQSAAVAEFCDRFAIGHDTRNDWQRIADNQAELFGEQKQLDMVQKLLLS